MDDILKEKPTLYITYDYADVAGIVLAAIIAVRDYEHRRLLKESIMPGMTYTEMLEVVKRYVHINESS